MLMSQNNQAKPIDPSLVPEVDVAVRMYEENGGHITLFSDFGRDPLLQRQDLCSLRSQRFKEQ